MKKYLGFKVITLLFLMHSTVLLGSAVTYTFSGGRLGDNLIAYLHAKWISYKYNMQLLYKNFNYSDQLALHDKEIRYSSDFVKKFKKSLELTKNGTLTFDNKLNALYTIPYFPESLEEHRTIDVGINQNNALQRIGWLEFPYFAVDWEDKKFLKIIRELIKPKSELKLINPPKNCLSIALHVRKPSGGLDKPLLNGLPLNMYDPNEIYFDVVFPLKFAPDSYYIDQLKRIRDIYKNEKIYVYVFTDDPNPLELVNKYKKEINDSKIEFDCRRDNNISNVLEDLFSMTKFDCLIRADSNLSIVASKLVDYKIAISPLNHYWEGRSLKINKVQILIN